MYGRISFRASIHINPNTKERTKTMQAIDMNDVIVSGNKAMICFTDWTHNSAELIIEQADDHTANVYGTHASIDIHAHITELPDTVTMLVHIKDITRKGINIMSSVAIDKSLFESQWELAEFGAVTKVVQEALQYALTYASLSDNDGTTGIERMNSALKNFSHKFAVEMYDYLKDDAKVTSIKKNASLIAA